MREHLGEEQTDWKEVTPLHDNKQLNFPATSSALPSGNGKQLLYQGMQFYARQKRTN